MTLEDWLDDDETRHLWDEIKKTAKAKNYLGVIKFLIEDSWFAKVWKKNKILLSFLTLSLL